MMAFALTSVSGGDALRHTDKDLGREALVCILEDGSICDEEINESFLLEGSPSTLIRVQHLK